MIYVLQWPRPEAPVAWFAYDDLLLSLKGAELRRHGAAQGLHVGRATTLLVDRRGQVYVGGEAGFARFDGRQFVTLTNEQEDVFTHVTGVVESASGDLWLNGGRGLVQLAARELAALPASGQARPNYRLLDWRDGLLAFRDAPLGEVAAEFNRYNARKLVVGDADAGALRIGGNFRWDNEEGFARLLEAGFPVRAEIGADRIVLHSR